MTAATKTRTPRATCARPGCRRTFNPTTDHQGRLRGGAPRTYCTEVCRLDARLQRDRAHRRYLAAHADLREQYEREAAGGLLPGMPALPPLPPFVLAEWL